MARVVLSASGMAILSRVVDRRALMPITEEISDDAQRYVPVLTGDLKRSLRPEHGPGFGRVWAGDVNGDFTDDGVDYHTYVEFGTSRMGAQPYLRPALYQRRSL